MTLPSLLVVCTKCLTQLYVAPAPLDEQLDIVEVYGWAEDGEAEWYCSDCELPYRVP